MKKFKINSGSIGAFLNILSYIFGGIMSFIGGILILKKLKELSKKFNNSNIFKYYAIAYVINISSIIFLFYFLGDFTVKCGDILYNTTVFSIDKIIPYLIVFFIIYVMIIIGTYFIRKSYINLSKYMDNSLINKIGNLYFYGAILSIFGIGLIMVLIAQFLEIKLYSEIEN